MGKISKIILAALLIASMLSVGAAAAGTAVLVEIDRETGGDWVGKYGSEGHIIITEDDSLQSIPAYAKLEYINDFEVEPAFWTWWDSDVGEEEETESIPSALFKTADRSSRLAACYYSSGFVAVTIDIGSETKLVTLYMMDYDRNGREVEVTASTVARQELVSPIAVTQYEEGWYLQFKMSGQVEFLIETVDGANSTISGIFFDPDPAEAVAAVETEPPEEETPAPAAPEAPVPAAPQQDTAPQTSDPIILIAAASIISTAGIIITRKKRGA